MIEIVVKDKVIKVDEELNIGQYQSYIQNKTIYDKEPARMLALCLGIEYSELKNLPKEKVDFVSNYLTTQFFDVDIQDQTWEVFEHDGIEYGLENDWSKLAWGAWVDLEVFSSDNIEQNIHRIMSILYRPIIDRKKGKYIIAPYDSNTVEDRAETFKKLPLKYWFGASTFFLLISVIYINNMQSSLNTKIKTNQILMRGWKILPKWIRRKIPLGSILHSLSNLPKKTSQDFNK